MKLFGQLIIFLCFAPLLSSAQVSQKAIDDFLNDSAVKTGHAGISIYDPTSKKYLYSYNADKNFLPGSNVKLFTLYAGMKYLGDSIPGLKYAANNSSIELYPTGDPTFLHPDFKSQPVFDFLTSSDRVIQIISRFEATAYGNGWAWEDYTEDFMAERSAFPIYGNVITFSNGGAPRPDYKSIMPSVKPDSFVSHNVQTKGNLPERELFANRFNPQYQRKNEVKKIPFLTSETVTRFLLNDTIHKVFSTADSSLMLGGIPEQTIYSRPADSLFRPMMFNSDNFFAEQTLLMVSNEKFGFMNDEKIIDTLLKNDLKEIPSKPRWVDGSGLSRYNLFSPKDFIYILDKLKTEFGWQRIKNILPTGGEGTLKNYYENIAGSIYAKTGSMSNNVSLSGYLITKKNTILYFSVLINNFSGKPASGRRAIEKLLLHIRETN